MPLQFQPLPIRFGALDTKTDPALLPPGGLTLAENATSQVDGVYSSRNAYAALGSGLTSCRRLLTRGTEVNAIGTADPVTGQSALWRYRTALGTWDSLTSASSIGSAMTSRAEVSRNQSLDLRQCTTGGNATTVVDAWIDASDNLWYRLTSYADGATMSGPFQIAGGVAWSFVRAITCGTTTIVIFASTAAQLVRAVTVDLTTGVVSAPTTLKSGANVSAANAAIDACALSSTQFLLAVSANAPSVTVTLYNVAAFAVAAGPTVMAAEAANRCMAIEATAGEFGVVLYHSTAAGGMRAVCFNPATTAVTVVAFTVEAAVVPLAVNCTLVRLTSTAVLAVWDRTTAATTKGYTQWRSISSAGALGALPSALSNYVLASKGFVSPAAGQVTVLVAYYSTSNTQNTLYAVSLVAGQTASRADAVLSYRAASSAAFTNRFGYASDVLTIATGIYRISANTAYKFLSTASPRSAVTSFTLDYTQATANMQVEVGGDALIAGALPSRYDGSVAYEQNFLTYPEILSIVQAGGGTMADGTYSYIAVFEYPDAQGNVDRSTTSLPKSITIAAGGGVASANVTVESLNLGAWVDSPPFGGTLTLFRTANAGLTYSQVASVTLARIASTVFSDTLADASIAANRQLYTTGGVLDREPPLPCRMFCVHQGRVFGISSEDRKLCFYSGDYAPGEGVWFSSLQQFRVDVGGDCIALASLDDKLIIFKSDRIFKVYGKGGNALGQSSDLTTPALLSSDCGCIEPRSAVQTPDGIMFLSSKGLYLLTRSEQVVYIGGPVEQWTTSYSACTSARMITNRREIRFAMTSPIAPLTTPACVDLVYNYEAKLWTTHLKYANRVSVDAVVVPGIGYVWADASGNVHYETSGFSEFGTFIEVTLQTGWIRPAGDQGLCRVGHATLLGEYKSPHALEMQIARNYANVFTMDRIWSSATLQATPNEQVDMHLEQQQGEAFQVRIRSYDDGLASIGEGMSMRGLNLLAALQRGSFKNFMQAGAKQ